MLQYESVEKEGKEQAKVELDKAQAKSDLYKGRVEDPSDKKTAPKVEVSACSMKIVIPYGSHGNCCYSTTGSSASPELISSTMQVGCLEEVILKLLEAKGEGEWGSVMFVPAGAISKPSKK